MRCFGYSGLVAGSFLKTREPTFGGPRISRRPAHPAGNTALVSRISNWIWWGGCNTVIPRDFVVWGSCSTSTAPTTLTAVDAVPCEGGRSLTNSQLAPILCKLCASNGFFAKKAEIHARGEPVRPGLAVKANSLRGLLRRFHQLADRFEQDNDFLIMSFNALLQFSQFSREFFVRS